MTPTDCYERRPQWVQAWQVTRVGNMPLWICMALEHGRLEFSGWGEPGEGHFVIADAAHLGAREGEWIVRDEHGNLDAMSDSVFIMRFRRV